jgi:hypothetical protein
MTRIPQEAARAHSQSQSPHASHRPQVVPPERAARRSSRAWLHACGGWRPHAGATATAAPVLGTAAEAETARPADAGGAGSDAGLRRGEDEQAARIAAEIAQFDTAGTQP